MHPDVHFMTVTTERQLLPGKAARGWDAEQVQPDAGLFRPLLDRSARALVASFRAIRPPSNTDVRHRTTSKRLIDMLPTE